jgi:metallo-beta-lactamase family protein
MPVEICFHGAAGTVTGSCIEIAHDGRRILVDCGLFQGPRSLEALNHGELPLKPSQIDGVLLTHAHLDHSGRLPALAKHGLSAPVWCSAPTSRLIDPLLADAAQLQRADVKRRNARPDRAGLPPFERLYDVVDVKRLLHLIHPVPLEAWQEILPGWRARFHDAHHVLGAVSIELEVGGRRLLFSGDIGEDAGAAPRYCGDSTSFDAVVCEATYGDRDRPRVSVEDRREQLAAIVDATMARGGNLLIPAFALERAQAVLEDLVALFVSGRIKSVPVYVDSPLADRITRVYRSYSHATPSPFDAIEVEFTSSVAQSRRLNNITGAIIIAGSGMCTGGRIRYHLIHNLGRAESTVLFVGYQVGGTLGAVLRGGAPSVRISGNTVPVRARIEVCDAYSAHADHNALLRWIGRQGAGTAALFLDHGEGPALGRLAGDAEALPAVPAAIIPRLGERFVLEAAGPRQIGPALPEAEQVTAPADWHNRYAALLATLEDRLRAAPDDRSRAELLGSLQAVVAGSAKSAPERNHRRSPRTVPTYPHE